MDGEDIATCPSCTLRIRVIFDEDKLPPLKDEVFNEEFAVCNEKINTEKEDSTNSNDKIPIVSSYSDNN
jgi:hypothetical protein